MEIVWRQCGESDSLYGDFMLKFAWGFHLPNNFHIDSTVKSLLKVSLNHSMYCLHTIYMFAVYYRDKIFLQCN